MPLQPCSKGTASLSDVSKAADRRHEHGVNIYLPKDGRGDGDGGRNPDLHHLAKLALVASADVPLDVLLKGRPPKPVEERVVGGVETLVTKMIMSITNEG